MKVLNHRLIYRLIDPTIRKIVAVHRMIAMVYLVLVMEPRTWTMAAHRNCPAVVDVDWKCLMVEEYSLSRLGNCYRLKTQ